jgi:TRAP-type C4-dicarboxylate transport system substrate-binding protein
MKRGQSIALVTLATLVGSAGLAAADTELRMATLAPTGSRWEKTLSEGGATIEKETGGRVKLKYYADAGQGDERDYIRKINQGQLDGAAVTSVGLAMIDESIRVLELPMMFESEEELDYVRGKMWKYFQTKFDKKGFMLGEEGDVGWVYFLSKKKVESLADLKNQKVWMWGDDQVVKETFKVLGISGVPLGVPEVDANLTSGKINACYGPPLAAMTLGWANKVKYMTSMPMSYAIGATVIKKDALKNISKDDLKKVQKVTKKVAKNLRKAVRKDNKSSEKQMKRKGVTITNVKADMIADFQTAAETVWKNLVGKVYSQDELDMVLKHRDEYRAKKGKKAASAAATK